MRYRTFGKLAWRPSALGFGAMRLPTIDGDPARIDESEATRMIRHAIDCGVNYVDTAWPYHRSTSEPFLGRALGDGYRERVKLATKLPCWLVKEPADFDRFLNDQLDRLATGTIDFYLPIFRYPSIGVRPGAIAPSYPRSAVGLGAILGNG